MGKIKSGILGGFSGKIGGVIGGSWKGIDYMRSIPTSVANPNTVPQQDQRAKFKGSVYWAQQLLGSILQVFWNPISAAMSGYNKFMSVNTENFNTSGVAIFADILTTQGSLLPVAGLSATADESSNNITVNWINNSGTGNALSTDESIVVVYNETQDYFKTFVGAVNRSVATQVVSDTDMLANDNMHIYLSFSRALTPKLASIPAYIMEIVVP